MSPLVDLLTDAGREDLIRGNDVTLLNVEVQCPPDPKKSGGQIGNCEPCIISSAFRDGEGGPAEMLAKVRAICATATDDFGNLHHAMMEEEQQEQEKTMEVFRKNESAARFLPYIMAGVFVWQLSVLAWMEDDGRVQTRIEYWVEESVLDREACMRVQERLAAVEEAVWGMG
jgi:hypothetical protein